jgi:hypothetical protein
VSPTVFPIWFAACVSSPPRWTLFWFVMRPLMAMHMMSLVRCAEWTPVRKRTPDMGYTLGSPEERGIGGRAYIWLATYQVRMPAGYDHEAVPHAAALAQRDLPLTEASLEVLRVKKTSPGRFTITFRRVRTGGI